MTRSAALSPGQHLCFPAVEHRLEHAFVGPEEADLGVSEDTRDEARNTSSDSRNGSSRIYFYSRWVSADNLPYVTL